MILFVALLAFSLVFLSACKKTEQSKAQATGVNESAPNKQVNVQNNESNGTTEAEKLSKAISEVDNLTVTNDSLDLDLGVFD